MGHPARVNPNPTSPGSFTQPMPQFAQPMPPSSDMRSSGGQFGQPFSPMPGLQSRLANPGGSGATGGGMTVAPPNIGGMQAAPIPSGGTSVADANARPPGGAAWWNTDNQYGNPHRTIDPNSSLPAWQQLGFYDKPSWEQRGKPTESGLQVPSLTDPKTGIYHWELYTPEWSQAFDKALQSNYQWRPKTYPGTPLGLDDPRTLAQIAEWKANGGTSGPSIATPGPARPIPWWMTGGSGVNPAGGSPSEPALWQDRGFASKADWRAANKPGMRTP